MGRHPANLTRHASWRLNLRSSLSDEELLTLLSGVRCKTLGVSGRTHLKHRVVWSPVDEDFLVAIQDVRTGTILTVLTLTMYAETYPENINPQPINRTVNLMVYAGLAPLDHWVPGQNDCRLCLFLYESESNNYFPLGHYPKLLDGPNLKAVESNLAFWNWIASESLARGYDLSRADGVYGRLPGGELTYLSYAILQDQTRAGAESCEVP